MQVLLIILAAVVLLPAPEGGFPARLEPLTSIGLVLGGVAALLVIAVANARLLQRRLAGDQPLRQFDRAARSLRFVQWAAVAIVAAGVLATGFREAVRGYVGDFLILDEAVTMAPALFAIVAAWWIFHPFEVRVRDATLIRRLDEGLPVHAAPSRGAWVAMQFRTQVLILLVPLGLLALTGDLFEVVITRTTFDPPAWIATAAPASVIVPIAILAPAMVVRLLGARPLPEGEVRTTLESMCVRAGVRVRNILLWPTGGRLVNAAVTGFVGPLRWVLLTDGLLETLRREQVMAVMAHELAHARRRHMPWMGVGLVAMSMVLAEAIDPMLAAIRSARIDEGGAESALIAELWWMDIGATAVVLTGTLIGFGWISRRFERQADAFAAVRMSVDADDRPLDTVSVDGVDAMRSALTAVAGVNGVDLNRFTWRHGSIASRQRHLLGLIHRPVDRLPIDRVVGTIKVASVVAIVLVSGRWYLSTSSEPSIFEDPGFGTPEIALAGRE
ncbi:MAG: hypothetical protein CMJ54_07565 [Planctomycetaceae bacterium]|nr:hypothetical protein [Planctomycetaceae bacterium]